MFIHEEKDLHIAPFNTFYSLDPHEIRVKLINYNVLRNNTTHVIFNSLVLTTSISDKKKKLRDLKFKHFYSQLIN